MAFDKNKLEDSLLDCLMEGFDPNNINESNKNTKVLIDCLINLSHALEDPNVSSVDKKGLQGWYNNMAIAYNNEIKSMLDYAEKNRSNLFIPNDDLQIAKQVSGVSLEKADKLKSDLEVSIAAKQAVSSQQDENSEVSYGSQSERSLTQQSESDKSLTSIKSKNIFQTLFDNVKSIFKAKPESGALKSTGLSSAAKVMQRGVAGGKRMREDSNDLTMNGGEPPAKRQRVEQPKQNELKIDKQPALEDKPQSTSRPSFGR